MRCLAALIPLAALVATLPASARAATFAAPVQPAVIEAGCDYRDTDCLTDEQHAGVDYLPDDSNEPILASADGIVRIVAETGDSHGFGNVVVLEHTLPGGGHVSTVYGHLRVPSSVKEGDCVRRGTRLGIMGDTGAAANVHLHFEVKEEPKIGPPWGYTSGDPDDYGYFDPKLYVGEREAVDICVPDVTPIEPNPADPGPDPDPAPASDCDGARASLPAVARGARETRTSGRVRGLPAGCRVQVSLLRRKGERCAHWRQSRRRMEWRACAAPMWTTVAVTRSGGLARWAHRFGARLVPGRYELRLRLVDRRGRVQAPAGYPAAAFSLG
jgi:hypothetical protein